MYIFSVTGVALTASFRLPETHTFHQTLPLPPKTTLIGMIGAAKGLGLEAAHSYVDENSILVGMTGSHKGMMKDLWNYRKITTKEKNYTEEQIKNRTHFSVLIREYLCDCEFMFYFGVGNQRVAAELRDCFSAPFYALTIGNSDDLFKVRTISAVIEAGTTEWKHFENTMLPGELSSAYKPNIDLKNMPITQSINSPQVYLLPTKFTFAGEERRVAERKLFTFIGSPVELNVPVQAYVVNSVGVVLH